LDAECDKVLDYKSTQMKMLLPRQCEEARTVERERVFSSQTVHSKLCVKN